MSRALLLFAFLTLAGLALMFWAVEATHDFLETPLALPPEGGDYLLSEGATLHGVSADMAERGWLAHPRWLRFYARVVQRGEHIQAGEYHFEPGTGVGQMLTMLERGEVKPYWVTLVEGWTVAEALAALARAEGLRQTAPAPEKLLAAIDPDSAIDFENKYPSPEGLFFPDTWRYNRGTTDMALLERAWQRMQTVLAEQWEQRSPGLPYKSPYEALIMASLIERETGVPAERGAIAGVFVRRLQRGMRLQTDPAVIYGLGPDFDGNLRRSHLEDAGNPWNTYRHHGLPPTPIALPGREAIVAALHPEPGTSLYFVARGDGSHAFSDTLEQHNAAVRRWQLRRRSDYRSAPAPAPAPAREPTAGDAP